MDHTDTLSQVALILAMAFAGEALLRRLRQPALVGYILVGFLLGPSVLGVVHDAEEISFLAELGILLLLFIVGLELDLRSFASVYRIAIATTLVQIAAGLAGTALVGVLFNWPLERAIVLGFAMSLSSTAVAIKLLEDMGGLNAPPGKTAIGILVAQDLAIIPMLLIIGGFEAGEFNPWSLLKIAAAVGGMAAAMVVLSRRDFVVSIPEWLKQPLSLFDRQTVIKGLAFCFCGAALSGALGLSASYGAFLAGLVLGSTQDHQKIEEEARPIFDILMMVFFLSVGLMIDLDFVREYFPSLITMLLLIMLVKTTVNVAALRHMGMSRRNAIVMGSVLGQIGEFSFVLAALGYSIDAIGQEGYQYIVTLIAFSLIFTPAWLYFMRRAPLFRRNIRRRLASRNRATANL